MDNIAPQSAPTQPPTTTKPRRLLWIIPLPAKQSKTTAIATTATTTNVTNAEPTFYENAIEWCHRADKVINLALGYLLAFASVLGFMDVLSNGEVLTHVPGAFYMWLAIMGLGVDFQIFLVIGRFPDLTRQLNGWPRFTFIVFNLAFLAFLCYMSATIGAVFTQHRDVANSTIVTAMQSLHIDATQFVYERAALATALLVLMAIDRTMERWRMQVSRDQAATAKQSAQTTVSAAQVTAQPASTQIDYEHLAKIIAQTMMSSAQQSRQSSVQQPVQVNEIAHPTQQAVIAQHSTAHDEHSDNEDATHITKMSTQPVLHIVRNEQSSVFEAESPAQAVQDSARQKVYDYLDKHPEDLDNNEAVMDGAKVNVHAARRYRGEYKKQRGGAQ